VLLLLRAMLLLRLRLLLRTQALLLRTLLLRQLLRLRAQASKLSHRARLWAKTALRNHRDFAGGKAKRHGFTSVAFCHLHAAFYGGIFKTPLVY
jgi:hypothetical protein